MEEVARAYLPVQTTSTNRCAGQGLPALQGDLLMALWAVGAEVVRAANGAEAKQRAEALFRALDALLTQLDLQSSGSTEG
jgi:hypothetical protein